MPKPMPIDIASISIDFLFKSSLDIILMSVAVIVPNIAKVAPPSIGFGICKAKFAIIGKLPKIINNIPTKYPTYLLLTPVNAITPLF